MATRFRLRWQALLAALIAGLLPCTPVQSQTEAPEYTVKAAYLYKLGAYVDWPSTAFASATSPIALCVGGDDPFGAVLETNVTGQQIAGRAIAVRRLGTVARGSGCHILYLAGSSQQPVRQALDAVRGEPVLTVTDAVRGDATGVVHFIVKDRRVRFDIDDEAAARNGLTVSSKLFALALSVKPRQ
jgi:hypothetical protein